MLAEKGLRMTDILRNHLEGLVWTIDIEPSKSTSSGEIGKDVQWATSIDKEPTEEELREIYERNKARIKK